MESKQYDDLKNLIIGLSTIKGIGTQTVKTILNNTSYSVNKFFKLSEDDLFLILNKIKLPFSNQIISEIINNKERLLELGKKKRDELKKKEIDLLIFQELPQKLKEIPDAPYWLFTQGNKELLFAENKVFISVIGTRNASTRGRKYTKRVIQVLSIYPVVVVSGLATGIDEAAHAFSLDKEIPNIAFLGNGIEIVFPKKTKQLRKKILKSKGVIVSEYLPRESYAKYRFIMRNRLQAAISDLLIPIEAKEKSGTAHTVKFGIKYKKPILGIKTNSGIEKLLKEQGFPIFDIDTEESLRKFDCKIQNLIEKKNISFDKVTTILNNISNSLRLRCFNNKDKERLIKEIKNLIRYEGDKNDKGYNISSEGYQGTLF